MLIQIRRIFEMITIQIKTNKDNYNTYTFNIEVLTLIADTLTLFDEKINHYFPSLDIIIFDWVRNPFGSDLNTTHQLELKKRN